MVSPRAAPVGNAAQTAARAERQRQNELAAIYFAASMGGIMAIFVISHFVTLASRHCKPKHNVVTGMTRYIRGLMLRKVPGFISQGHATVFAVYIAIMAILFVTNMDWSSILSVGKRAGWLAASNIALLAFLGMKNTPLAFLTAYSYERINVLHQLAGYITVMCMLVHGIIELTYFSQGGQLWEMASVEDVCGIIAGCAMLVILATAIFIRRIRYELFYIVHIVMFMLILIVMCLHRPNIITHTMIIILVAAGIWSSDRTIRAARLVYNSYHGHVTITPLSENGIRVVFTKPTLLGLAKPGSHIFVWIPRIRPFETHPFTLTSTNPMELVISAHDGFTRDLLTYARNHPGAKLRASIDGPYGTVPNFSNFDQVIMIAGGSGATFAFGVAIDLVRKLSRHPQGMKPVLNFIWTIRERGSLSWFAKELEELQASAAINLIVHVTRAQGPSTLSLAQFNDCRSESSATTRTCNSPNLHDDENISVSYPEKGSFPVSREASTLNLQSKAASIRDSEKLERDIEYPSTPNSQSLSLLPGRPDAKALIRECIAGMGSDEGSGRRRAIVAVCGPESLMTDVRNTAAEIIKASVSGGPSVELHCEQFGW